MSYNLEIKQIDVAEAESLCRSITSDLPEYFGIPESNEQYAIGVRSRHNFAAKINDKYVALLSLGSSYPTNCSIYWMGILRSYHRSGIGKQLLQSACDFAKNQGFKTITVETLSPQESDEGYLKTYKFYEACGFKPLFNLQPTGCQYNMVYMFKNLNTPVDDLILLEQDARGVFGFNWPHQEMIINHAISECQEIKDAINNQESSQRIQEEIGDLLHIAISLCIFTGYDFDETIKKTVEKFGYRINALKNVANKHGFKNLKGQSYEFMLKLWREVKSNKSYSCGALKPSEEVVKDDAGKILSNL